jgi:hypothetical protein
VRAVTSLLGRSASSLTPPCSDRELLAGTGRRHSNLDFAEYDFHAFSKVRHLRLVLVSFAPADVEMADRV